MRQILLMGNPNVGKSVVFSRLTGADVMASNYPGTTVEFTKGRVRLGEETAEVLDPPGTYTLHPTNRAEAAAVEMLAQADLVINVVDATTLERNLNLTLDLLHSGTPMVVALNMWDEAQHKGVEIDVARLERLLGVPVIPTSALRGQGFKELVSRLSEAQAPSSTFDEEERWQRIGTIVERVQRLHHRHHSLRDWLEDVSVQPLGGMVVAVLVGLTSFWTVRHIGEGLIGYIFDPLFEGVWAPLMLALSRWLGGEGLLHAILIGTLAEGEIDFGQSFGLLTTGLYVPFAAVLPYVVAFYVVLGILEDTGYLPRLGVLMDAYMHRLGLHGLAIVPMLLGLGCNVPGALATRILETRKERFISGTLMAIAVPCMAQLAMIVGLLGRYGVSGLLPLFGTLFVLWVVLGIILHLTVAGETPEILLEIPPYRFPYWKALLKKLWIRVRQFITEAVPYVLLGVAIASLLYSTGVVQFIGNLAAPVIRGLLGLPEATTGALIVGFLSKDVAVGMLAPLNLELRQLIVACVILAIYFPCIATFAVLLRELGAKDMLKAAAIMVVTALAVGSLLNFSLGLVLP